MSILDSTKARPLLRAIKTLVERWPDLREHDSSKSPIFVLAAGWRSGSTLLQRLLMPPALIWASHTGTPSRVRDLLIRFVVLRTNGQNRISSLMEQSVMY